MTDFYKRKPFFQVRLGRVGRSGRSPAAARPGGGELTGKKKSRREARRVADEQIDFSGLRGQTPRTLLRALAEPAPRYATWSDVRNALMNHWLKLDHDAAQLDAVPRRTKGRARIITRPGVVTPAFR